MARKPSEGWSYDKLMDWFNSRTFAEILDSFEFVYKRTPSLKEFVSLGLYNGERFNFAQAMYPDACGLGISNKTWSVG